MAKKLKDYYTYEYIEDLATKIKTIWEDFPADTFSDLAKAGLYDMEFLERQTHIALALRETMPASYPEAIRILEGILGPELEGNLDMFKKGWWLWPIGRFVELYGAEDFETSTEFSKELTKRFTSEYCMRPVIRKHEKEAMELLIAWSKDPHMRVKRLASECIRPSLPWSSKLDTAFSYWDEYVEILTNLLHDEDKTIQKSVANNLNDIYKLDRDKYVELYHFWEEQEQSKASAWILKHGSRTERKDREAK